MMHLAVYKPLEGGDYKRKIEYDKSRNICNRYTTEELQNWKHLDLYFVLGIDSMRECYIPPHVLKFVYYKQTMTYHPDVSGYPSEALLAVQKAYKVLSDPVQRRKYDSIHFDEALPEDREYGIKEFFGVFSDVFVRNAKFSKVQPVPALGDANTSKEEVVLFYKFWNTFDSWRSFEFLDEEDGVLMSRDERRFLEKSNRAKWTKKKNEDTLRVRRLVEIAMKRDPRISRRPTLRYNVDPKLTSDGWPSSDVSLLIKLLDEVKAGTKCRFDVIAKKFNSAASIKKDAKSLFLKHNQISASKKYV